MVKPDSKTKTYTDDIWIITETKSLVHKKREQNRAQLRTLLNVINEELSDFKLRNAKDRIYVDYLKNHKYGGSLNDLLYRLASLKNSIINEIELSKANSW